MADELIIKNIRPLGGPPADILVRAGVIDEIGSDLAAPAGAGLFDGVGALALPGLVNAHMHLDKTRWGLPWRPHVAGRALEDRIAADKGSRAELMPSVQERARALVEQCVAMGTSHIRSHVDVEPEFGLAAVEALLDLADAMRAVVDIELVAFPQFGLLTNRGTAALMEEAAKLGVACVGGIDPSMLEGDADGHLDTVFGIAERTGAGIDIHLHEMGEEGARSLDMICARTKSFGMQGRVAVSHAFCLSTVDAERCSALVDRLASAGVGIVTCVPGRAPVLPIELLRGAGVTVAVGTDGVRDAWTPYGNGDMLERAMMLAYRSDFRRDDDIETTLAMALSGGAALLGVERHGLEAGDPADIVLVGAESVAQAVVERPPGRAVFKRGRRVA